MSIVSSAFTHFAIVKVLTDVYDYKFLGICIASSVHFMVRGFVGVVCFRNMKAFKKVRMPLCTSDSFKELGPVI